MVDWTHIPGLAPYPETLAAMEAHVAAMNAGTAGEAIWLLEHPPLYTAGTSAKPADLVDPDRFPVYPVGRKIVEQMAAQHVHVVRGGQVPATVRNSSDRIAGPGPASSVSSVKAIAPRVVSPNPASVSDPALVRRDLVDRAAVQADLTVGGGLEPGQHHQTGGLARSGRPEHGQELALGDGQVQVLHDQRYAVITLLDVLESDESVVAGLNRHPCLPVGSGASRPLA